MTILDLQDLKGAEPPGNIIVVGSGLAGIAIAQGLEKAGQRVVVLESGNQDNPDARWNVRKSPFAVADYWIQQDFTQLHIRRQFGGTSAVWGGWCAIPRAVTFESRRLGPSYGWPIGRDALRPYYEKAAHYLELDTGSDFFAEERSLSSTGNTKIGKFFFSPPVRVLDEFGEGLAQSKLITVIQNATVVNLLEADGSVGGCIIESDNGSKSVIKGNVIVLCGGAVGNARLLGRLTRASGIALDAQRNIGKWLQEHPHKYRMFECLLRPDVSKEIFSQGLINQEKFVSLAPHEDLVRKNKWADFNFQIGEKEHEISQEMLIMAQNYRSFFSVTPVVFEATLGMEQLPRVENSAISSKALAEGLDGDLNLAFGEDQDELVGHAVTWFTRNIAHSISKPAVPVDTVAVGHLHGTTRMAASPEFGVVDSSTKVFGVKNLYVAGSSVMPTNGFANPTFTICALAIRTADIILKEMKL
jgi:choline dehydrogenase-like flavoprotein